MIFSGLIFFKNRCSKIFPLLSGYIDGELSPKEKALVERHIKECSVCSWEIKSLKKTSSLLKLAPKEKLRDKLFLDYWRILEKKLSKPSALLRLRPRLATALSLVAAATLLVFISFFLGKEPEIVISTDPSVNRCVIEWIELSEQIERLTLFTTPKSGIKIIWVLDHERNF